MENPETLTIKIRLSLTTKWIDNQQFFWSSKTGNTWSQRLDYPVIQRYQFESIYDAGLVMNRWKDFYNDRRLHGRLKNKTPQKTWDIYFEKTGNKMIQNREIHTQNRLTNIELLSSS